jgi:malic enzyme
MSCGVVAETAMEQGVARKPVDPALLKEHVRSRMWVPEYARYTKGKETA